MLAWSLVAEPAENRRASMILNQKRFTLGIRLFISNLDLFQESLIKFDSLSLKIICQVVIGFSAHFKLISDGVDFVIKDPFIFSNKG